MGGVRVSARKSRTVQPFAQVLVGGVNASAEAEGRVTMGGQTIFETSESESSTNFGMQIGGGATIWLGEKIGVRAAVDYLTVFAEESGVNAVRVAGGVVFGF